MTRSMGQGDTMEVPSSPVRRAKRARLCSSSSSVSGPGRLFLIQGFGVVPQGYKEGFLESLNHPVVVSLLCHLLASQDTSLRSFFHPGSQHRDWCPWVSTREGEESLEDATSHTEKEPGKAEAGWEVVLKRLLGIQKCDTVPETEPVVSPTWNAARPGSKNLGWMGFVWDEHDASQVTRTKLQSLSSGIATPGSLQGRAVLELLEGCYK